MADSAGVAAVEQRGLMGWQCLPGRGSVLITLLLLLHCCCSPPRELLRPEGVVYQHCHDSAGLSMLPAACQWQIDRRRRAEVAACRGGGVCTGPPLAYADQRSLNRGMLAQETPGARVA